mgnify:CR=1 FL=1
MKKDVHFKIDDSLIYRLDNLSKDIGLPVTRLIETAIREYITTQRTTNYYRITGINQITGERVMVSARYKDIDVARAALDNFRRNKREIADYYTKLQLEKVTL